MPFNYHAKLYILNKRSFVVFNGRIFHEAVKGLVNKKLNMDFNDKILKDGIKDFVYDIKELARKYIWLERCKEVNVWENNNGITMQLKKQVNVIIRFIWGK